MMIAGRCSKLLRNIEIAALSFAGLAMVLLSFYSRRWEFSIGLIVFSCWALLPYATFFAMTSARYKKNYPVSLPLVACTVSVLILLLTLLVSADCLRPMGGPAAMARLLGFVLTPLLLLIAGPLLLWVLLLISRLFTQRVIHIDPRCCMNCGYDLRASTEQCPECGTGIPSLSPERQVHPPKATARRMVTLLPYCLALVAVLGFAVSKYRLSANKSTRQASGRQIAWRNTKSVLVGARREDKYPLHKAARQGNVSAVKASIASGTDVNVGNDMQVTPLHQAVSAGDDKMVRLLVASGADVNASDKFGKTPLFRAGTKAMVHLLVAHGADIDLRDNSGSTALFEAASSDAQNGALTELITQGLDVNARNSGGRTPLHNAAISLCTAAGKILLAGGADINATDDSGLAPLHFAVGTLSHLADKSSNDSGMAQLLIANGADVNAQKRRGSTPLSYAAWYGHLDMVKLLLANDADINRKGYRGRTPLQEANKRGHTDVVSFLRKNGATE